jgi:transcriptional regulator with XRE-family HTH domain
MIRPTFADFKKKALADPEVREAYETLKPTFDLKKRLIALRTQAGLTQEQLAERLHTQKSNISRLESANNSSSPRLSTLEQYAQAVGYRVEVNFVPSTRQSNP